MSQSIPPGPPDENELAEMSFDLYDQKLPSGIQDVPSQSNDVDVTQSVDSTPVPPSLIESNPLSIIPKVIAALNDPGNKIGILDAEFFSSRARFLREAIGVNPDSNDHDVLILRLMNIYRNFPEEPKDGFEHVFQYGLYLKQLNQVMAYFHALAKSEPQRYRLRDPENPQKFRGHFYFECADGRNSLVPFKNPERVLNIFDTEWLPSAGTIIFPEISAPATDGAISELFNLNPELKARLFARLEFLCGKKIKELLEDYENDELSVIWFEYQAHYDGVHYPNHGCGAHKSDLNAAQLETLKNCFITEAWLRETYPTQFKKGIFKVFRTCHDTGEGRPIYTAKKVDDEKLSEDKKNRHYYALEYAHKHFEAPHLSKAGSGIVRKYHGNPTGIDMAEHDEQTIRISNQHFASTLMGQSVMEMCWTDDVDTLFEHTKVLISIIEKNFRNPKVWAEKEAQLVIKAKKHKKAHPPPLKIPPTIVHFDLIKGDAAMNEIYEKLINKLSSDESIAAKLEEGSLQFIATTTDRDTYKLRLKV